MGVCVGGRAGRLLMGVMVGERWPQKLLRGQTFLCVVVSIDRAVKVLSCVCVVTALDVRSRYLGRTE